MSMHKQSQFTYFEFTNYNMYYALAATERTKQYSMQLTEFT